MDKETCPALFVKDVLDWGMEDPKEKSIDEVRKIRDDIKIKVKELIEKLENEQIEKYINIFVAELVGTFGLVFAATGSIVFDGRMDFSLGPIFVAECTLLVLTILVYVLENILWPTLILQ